ncbi:hypothetical protein [Vibrio cholerae]|nr:hypothetical protein [Vibrio cholerae]
MISEQLARYPILLDELIDPQHLYNPIHWSLIKLSCGIFWRAFQKKI